MGMISWSPALGTGGAGGQEQAMSCNRFRVSSRSFNSSNMFNWFFFRASSALWSQKIKTYNDVPLHCSGMHVFTCSSKHTAATYLAEKQGMWLGLVSPQVQQEPWAVVSPPAGSQALKVPGQVQDRSHLRIPRLDIKFKQQKHMHVVKTCAQNASMVVSLTCCFFSVEVILWWFNYLILLKILTLGVLLFITGTFTRWWLHLWFRGPFHPHICKVCPEHRIPGPMRPVH